jgi:uncharacterized protein (DUF2236 family)
LVVLVSVDALESSLARLRAEVRDPGAGLFGPGSALWQVNREAVIFLGGGRAALLQLAHPWVAHAIDQHSVARDDVAGRFQRTFENVFAMAFGGLGEALTSARRVHAVHTRIRGTLAESVGEHRRGDPYWANEPEAMLWVAATLWDTSVQVHERFVGPLSLAEKERYYAETLRFTDLFGIPRERAPADWTAFQAYTRSMLASETLAVGEVARELAASILAARRPSTRPLMGWIRLLTAGLLPPRFRAEFGMRYGRGERAAFAASTLAVRAGARRLPGRLRYLPAYVDAQRRLAGRRPSRTSALLERSLQHLLAPGVL